MATETLRPIGPGSETSLDTQFPVAGAHWAKVCDVVPDDAESYVKNKLAAAGVWQRDLYALPSHREGYGAINSVTVYIRIRGNASQAQASIRTNGVTQDSPDIGSAPWTTKSYTWALNPVTGVAWTWGEIDAPLEIGVRLRGTVASPDFADCTQVYVEIDCQFCTPTARTGIALWNLVTSATLEGVLDDGRGEVCVCGFEWGTTAAYGSTTPTQNRNTGQSFSQVITVAPGITYHYRALATSSFGTTYGEDRTFTTAKNQSFHPIPIVDLGQGTGGWGNVDVSAHIPAGATGVILRVGNRSPAVRNYGLRMNGSTDNRVGDMSGNCQCWAMMGVDAGRIFQSSNPSGFPSKIQFYLYGYTTAGVHYHTNAPSRAGVGGAWTTLDLSEIIPGSDGDPLVSKDAIGVILEVRGGVGADLGVRKKGSTDNRIAATGNRHNTFSCIVGLGGERMIEVYGVNTWYLTGYITEGVLFNENAIDVTPVGAGAWEDLPAINRIPPVMGIFEITSVGNYDLRENGGASVMNGYRMAVSHPWALCACDADGLIEAMIQLVTGGVHLVGYAYEFLAPGVQTDPATAVGQTTATLNGTLDDDGREACDVRFQYGETIAYGINTAWQLGKESVVAFAQAITGLSPNTTYHFRAQARNSAGTVNGDDRTFTTNPALAINRAYALAREEL